MGLRENILNEPVSSLPIREVITVKRKTTVREAAKLMRAKQLGCVIVVDSRNKPVGKFTERKIMRLLVDNPKGMDEPVEKFMYPSANPVSLEDTIGTMIQTMQKGELRFLCVVDKKGRAVGLTGQKGLMEYIVEHFPRQIKAQRLKPFMAWPEREGA